MSFSPLPLLGPHIAVLLGSAGAFFGIQQLTHRFGPSCSKSWNGFDDRIKNGVASHVVSMAHALIIIPLALHAVKSDILARDPVFGYDRFVGNVLAISSGYFIWDTIDSLRYSTLGFVVHGACCLAVYLFSFRPFLAGFGPPFLLWELSTPLLNIHWFMDKLGLSTTYPTFFLINALAFMLVFFLARIVYGGYESMVFFHVMWTRRHEIPLHLHLIYCIGNLSLNALNWLWFSKMVKKMLARVSGDDKPVSESKRAARTNKMSPSEKQSLLEVSTPTSVSEDKMESTNGRQFKQTLSLPADPPSPNVSTSRKTSEGW
ncbi:TLC domain-domain-containing protein [Kockovaella imperatae]|uniref:TLC domain-domain-containing protein n=1 Tax=Kockovaella imperatae TaxID=4999 RepID=A0A1Y1U796_9TREE|nr:TLC domain-domain-containing protein [Kockovaella imperatae]ORX33899.1 TLC domain-domain-containing protein [Kockovaella imperatae]